MWIWDWWRMQVDSSIYCLQILNKMPFCRFVNIKHFFLLEKLVLWQGSHCTEQWILPSTVNQKQAWYRLMPLCLMGIVSCMVCLWLNYERRGSFHESYSIFVMCPQAGRLRQLSHVNLCIVWKHVVCDTIMWNELNSSFNWGSPCNCHSVYRTMPSTSASASVAVMLPYHSSIHSELRIYDLSLASNLCMLLFLVQSLFSMFCMLYSVCQRCCFPGDAGCFHSLFFKVYFIGLQGTDSNPLCMSNSAVNSVFYQWRRYWWCRSSTVTKSSSPGWSGA